MQWVRIEKDEQRIGADILRQENVAESSLRGRAGGGTFLLVQKSTQKTRQREGLFTKPPLSLDALPPIHRVFVSIEMPPPIMEEA